MKEYKQRELRNEEYNFIAEDESGELFATYRGYRISDEIVEGGSWVTKPGYTKWINAIKVDVIVKELVFNHWGFQEAHFNVRKKNKTVLSYHLKYNPTMVKENELDCFFSLSAEQFRWAENSWLGDYKKRWQ